MSQSVSEKPFVMVKLGTLPQINSSPDGAGRDTTALARGCAPLDVDALQRHLQQLAPADSLSPQQLQAYRQFYGFDVLLDAVEHQVFWHATQGEQIAIHVLQPTKQQIQGYALVCHGYYDHVGLYGHLISYLVGRGWAVVSFDQVGHGLSTGARATISNFDIYVAVTYAVYQRAQQLLPGSAGQEWYWLGQSMGGAIVLETLHQQPAIAPRDVVLFAPLVRPYAWWFARWVYALAKHTVESRPRRITTNASNVEFITLQHADPLQADILPVQWVSAMVDWFERFERYPVAELAPLIIQGEQDKTVDWKYGTRLLKKRYPASRWLNLTSASHHLVNESDTLRAQMWSWLDQQLADGI